MGPREIRKMEKISPRDIARAAQKGEESYFMEMKGSQKTLSAINYMKHNSCCLLVELFLCPLSVCHLKLQILKGKLALKQLIK